MKELLDKISSYNIFNNLFPGIIFVFIFDEITSYSLATGDIFIGLFIYYFIGIVISRFGSLVIEPILKKLSFIKFADHTDFVSASEKDSHIEIFLEVNNMYRSLISMFILLIFAKLYELLLIFIPWLASCNQYLIILSLLVLFLFSYKKQTRLLSSRIDIKK